MSERLLPGYPVTMADSTTIRVRTIPFTEQGFEIARLLDELTSCTGDNRAVMERMLEACLAGVRLNYPDMTRDRLASMLDIECAHKVIAALRGDVEFEL